MVSGIHWTAASMQQLEMGGVEQGTGVFRGHTVQLGRGTPLRLADIKSFAMPYAGFTRAKKVERGKKERGRIPQKRRQQR